LGPFWSGPFWFAWAVFDLHWGRFGDGPFWSVPVTIVKPVVNRTCAVRFFALTRLTYEGTRKSF